MDQEGSAPVNPPRPTRQVGTASNVLKLKGLPYSTTKEQIFEFFTGYNLLEVGFVFEPDGRASGLAFAEFESSEEATRALTKNGDYLGNRYIKLLRVPRREMEEQLEKGTAAIPGNHNPLNRLALNTNIPPWPLQSQLRFMPTNQIWGLGINPPPGITLPGNQLPLLPGLNLQPPMRPQHLQPEPGMDLSRFVQDLRLSLPNVPPFGPLPQLSIQNSIVPTMHSLGIPQVPRRPPVGTTPPLPGITPTTFHQAPKPTTKSINTDGSTIKIRGLPFKSTKEEIVSFFSGYDYVEDSLYIGQDPYGRPSGEAWLTFVTPEEARQAVRTRNREYLGKRYLELSVCNGSPGPMLSPLGGDAPAPMSLPHLQPGTLGSDILPSSMPSHFLVDNQQ